MDYDNIPFNYDTFNVLKKALKACLLAGGGDVDPIDTKEELIEAVEEFFDHVTTEPKD